jgi:hypothetical protein
LRAVKIVDDVLFGGDGQLFLAQGGHRVLDVVTGRRPIDPGLYAAFDANITARHALCAAGGAAYLHVVFPDKQSVLRADYPVADPISVADMVEERCAARAHLLNLGHVLRRQDVPPYKRTDTHLTDLGCAVAASAVAERLSGQAHGGFLDHVLTLPRTARMIAGDLGGRLKPPVASSETFFEPDWTSRRFTNDIAAGNDGMADIIVSPGAVHDRRLLWFGDSFGRGCLRYLSFFFREITFLRTRYLHREMFEQIRPDIVVTQTAERYMATVSADAEATPFLLYPALKGIASTPTLEFARALAAVLSYPRPPYARFMAAMR